jgi:predicted component of type VI protein secretion system
VARSVIAYGLRQVVCRRGPWEERFKSEILRVLLAFEPRIVAESISVSALSEQEYLHVTIAGQLLAFPINKDFELRARIDRESGEIQIH